MNDCEIHKLRIRLRNLVGHEMQSCLLQSVSIEQDGLLLSITEFFKQKNCLVLRCIYEGESVIICTVCFIFKKTRAEILQLHNFST